MLHKELKEKQRKLRDNFPEGLALRVHRALSWLDKSEQCNQDLDCQFIFYGFLLMQHMHKIQSA